MATPLSGPEIEPLPTGPLPGPCGESILTPLHQQYGMH
nr:MAG TPA: hypothetical protein [Caudoviricetes sp.]